MMQFSSFRKSILTVTITVLEVVKLRLKRKITFQFSTYAIQFRNRFL